MDYPTDFNKKRPGPWDDEIQKVGIDAFNDLAKSHDAHVKEVERLQEELNELNKLKLVDQHGELLLECRIGDENHRVLLEVGLNTILKKIIKEEK